MTLFYCTEKKKQRNKTRATKHAAEAGVVELNNVATVTPYITADYLVTYLPTYVIQTMYVHTTSCKCIHHALWFHASYSQ